MSLFSFSAIWIFFISVTLHQTRIKPHEFKFGFYLLVFIFKESIFDVVFTRFITHLIDLILLIYFPLLLASRMCVCLYLVPWHWVHQHGVRGRVSGPALLQALVHSVYLLNHVSTCPSVCYWGETNKQNIDSDCKKEAMTQLELKIARNSPTETTAIYSWTL